MVLHRLADKAAARDRKRVLGKPVARPVAQEERGREVLHLVGGEEEGHLAVDQQLQPGEEPCVAGEEAARLLADVTAVVADAEGRALEDRQRHVI